MTRKVRLDIAVSRQRKDLSAEEVEKLILSGQVKVNDSVSDKVGALIASDSIITFRESKEFVGRGAFKLTSALNTFKISVQGKCCADVGSSTGGFTEVLLQNGAKKVFAIDVGYGELDWKLRKDDRVVVMERTNARYLESLPEPPQLVTIDVSFISLKLILPSVLAWTEGKGDIIALIKPQFEAAKEEVGEGGVINNKEIHIKILKDILDWCEKQELYCRGLCVSGLPGAKGNKEFFVWIGDDKKFAISANVLINKLQL